MRVLRDLEGNESSEINEEEEQEILNYLKGTPGTILDHGKQEVTKIAEFFFSMYNIYIIYTKKLRDMPMSLQVPLDGPHVKSTRPHLFFRCCEQSYQRHELPDYNSSGFL